ncbi:MAG: VPDSG-CTERM sorting domain-containing protein [Verrucomicrobiota bacterium]
MKQTFLTILAISALAVPFSGKAVNIMPDYSTVPAGWTTDRYEPTSFSNVGSFAGRSDVLGIEITSAGNLLNRPAAYQSSFYNTQGRQHALIGGSGSSIAADLYIPSSWSDPSQGSIRSDMWGVMTDGAAVTSYPILGFTTYGGASRFRYWDNAGGSWVDLAASVNYDGWNSLSIDFTGTTFEYYINGSLVGTDGAIGGGTTGFQAVIMQAYNFADPAISGAVNVDYTAHWSNTQSVPDAGSTLALMGVACASIAGLRRKFNA